MFGVSLRSQELMVLFMALLIFLNGLRMKVPDIMTVPLSQFVWIRAMKWGGIVLGALGALVILSRLL